MATEHVVIAEFRKVHQAIKAVKMLQNLGMGDAIESYSPFPEHHLEDAVYEGRKRSPVRRCTLLGGLSGCLFAFAFTSWMSVDYPLRVSAKPLVSFPAFIIIAFECTILLGAIFTLAGMGFFSQVPNLFRPGSYRPVFSEGTFGVVVRVPKEKGEELKRKLESWGGENVEVKYVR